MHLLFIDESDTPPNQTSFSNNPIFVLGGIVISEDCWGKMANDLAKLKKEYKISGEIKWRYFAPPHPDQRPKAHSLSHLDYPEKERVRTAIYSIIRAYKSNKLICIVVNAEKAYTSKGKQYIKDADDLYEIAYKQVMERFQYHLQDMQREVGTVMNGIIVCDNRAPKSDDRLRELHAKLLENGKSSYSRYNNLVEGLFIVPSHLSVGIQFADMVAGAVYRKARRDDDRFFSQIKESLRKNPKTGSIEGYGLIRWPK